MGRVQSSLVLNDQMSKVLGRINKAMGSVLDKSLIDNNVWSPSAYPAGWQQIKEG